MNIKDPRASSNKGARVVALRPQPDVGRVKRPNNGVAKKKESESPITKARMQVRVMGLAVFVAIFFAVLGFRLWHLQVLAGEEYQDFAQATQTRSTKIPAQRGVIYDRNGEVLANNQPGLNVTIVPSAMERETVGELVGVLDANEEAVLARYDAALLSDPYGPMLVKENATREDVMYVSERTEEYPGLVVNDDYVRNYPNGELAAHALGFTGAISEEELGSEVFEGLDNDAVVGKSGVEFSYEEVLRGEAGRKEYDVDALGRQVTIRSADGRRYDGSTEEIPEMGQPARATDPLPGSDLRLTIDLELQRTAEEELEAALERAREAGHAGTGGAAIALDANSGEVLAMAGRPTFDPQMFIGGITGAEEISEYEYLNSEEANAPFTNRAIYGTYPGASTFKVFTGMAGLDQGAINPSTTVTDTGECWRPAASVGGCWQSWRENSPKYQFLGPHGTQNYAQALGDSNNKYFYQVADWMWGRTDDENLLPQYYRQFGFGQRTGVDLVGESEGRVPTREWQQEAGPTPDDQLWTVGRWVNMSIGQGDLLVTPLQMIRGYAAIANGGTLVTPRVGAQIADQGGTVAEDIAPEPAGDMGLDPGLYRETIKGLRMVTKPGGTAENIFAGSPLNVVGKSGTSELEEFKDPVNWFIGWDESRGDPVLVLVMIEEGGAFQEGSELTVGPAVRNILEAYHGLESSPNRNSSSTSSESSTGPDETSETPEEQPAGGGPVPEPKAALPKAISRPAD